MTFPGGTHDLWIRYWLAAGGIDPDKDIETIMVPPPQMVANMKVGTMDCFCVVRAVEPAAHPPEASATPRSPPASSGTSIRRSRSACAPPASTRIRTPRKAILMAVMEAQQWCEKPENHAEVAAICAKRQWINVPGRGHHRPRQGQVRLRHPGKVVEKHAADDALLE